MLKLCWYLVSAQLDGLVQERTSSQHLQAKLLWKLVSWLSCVLETLLRKFGILLNMEYRRCLSSHLHFLFLWVSWCSSSSVSSEDTVLVLDAAATWGRNATAPCHLLCDCCSESCKGAGMPADFTRSSPEAKISLQVWWEEKRSSWSCCSWNIFIVQVTTAKVAALVGKARIRAELRPRNKTPIPSLAMLVFTQWATPLYLAAPPMPSAYKTVKLYVLAAM